VNVSPPKNKGGVLQSSPDCSRSEGQHLTLFEKRERERERKQRKRKVE